MCYLLLYRNCREFVALQTFTAASSSIGVACCGMSHTQQEPLALGQLVGHAIFFQQHTMYVFQPETVGSRELLFTQ